VCPDAACPSDVDGHHKAPVYGLRFFAGKVCERGLTWIKPSFLWMMYRCGWGAEAGQETVLAVAISRDGFNWALSQACLSSYVRRVYPDRATWQRQLKRAPTRAQWDPERDLHLQPLPHRSLQLGLSGEAVRRYADGWTVTIRDVTPLAHDVHALVSCGELDSATRLLPQELPYLAIPPERNLLPASWDDGPAHPAVDRGRWVTRQHRLGATGVKPSTPFGTTWEASCPTGVTPAPEVTEQ